MEQALIMLRVICTFALIILIGFVAAKTRFVRYDTKDAISALILRITMPALIFTSLTSMNRSADLLLEIGYIVLWAILITLTLLGIALLIGQFMRLPKERAGVQVCLMTFGNVVFIAFPLMEALFGALGVFFAAFYHLVNDVFLWGVGRGIIDIQQKPPLAERLRKLFNINMIALLLGLVCFLLEWRLPPILHEPLGALGKTTTYLSLLFIGIAISASNLKVFAYPPVYIVVAIKLLIIPAIVTFVMSLIPGGAFLALSSTAAYVVIIQAATPSMTVTALIANEVGADATYASGAIFITTVCSILTLPLIYSLAQYLIR